MEEMSPVSSSTSCEITEDDLLYTNDQHTDILLSSLNMMRKNRKFCDLCLVIGAHEVPVHRAVLASASSYLLELFQKHDDEQKDGTCKVKDIDYESFQYLLDYIYTSRLAVPAEHVKLVYQAAVQLKMTDAANSCSLFLAANLSTANCLGIRQYAVDDKLKKSTDEFIQNNINDVHNSKNFFGLPRIAVEIIGADDDLVQTSSDKHMFQLVLNWAKDKIDPEKPRIDSLTEQVNVFNLNPDNTITDYIEINDERNKEEIVQEYIKKKAKSRKCSKAVDLDNHQAAPGGLYVRKFSIYTDQIQTEKEWTIIATYQMKDKTYMAIAMLHGILVKVSIHYREAPKSAAGSGSEDLDSPDAEVIGNGTPQKNLNRHASLTPLAVMGSARCGFGLCAVQGKLIACGGYDCGECLRSVECYNIKTNKWEPLPEMKTPRGRFSAAVANDSIYAIGGSNGQEEQQTLDKFEPAKEIWTSVCNARSAKVSQGVTELNGKMYAIGGCYGQKSVTDCVVFDPKTNQWSMLPSLNTARYQAGVCSYGGRLYAMGGTDGWNCLNSMEIFDFETNQWQYGPNLNCARRGAGCEVMEDKIYIIGGNDGQQSLKSVEVLDLEKDAWGVGPSLSVPRANVAVTLYTNRIFAVGGFSGRKFLESMEYLDPVNLEWCCYLPVEDSAIGQRDSNRNSPVLVNDKNSAHLSNGCVAMTNGH